MMNVRRPTVSGVRRLILKAGWAPAAVVVLHAGVARVFGHNPSLDPAMHFLGGAAGAYFASQAVTTFDGWFGQPRPWSRALIAFSLTTTAAVFWEFAEFVSGAVFKAYSQLTLEETMGDLLLGCTGALVFLTIDRLAALRR